MKQNRMSLEQWLYFGRPSHVRSLARAAAAVLAIAVLTGLLAAVLFLPSDWGLYPWPSGPLRVLIIGAMVITVGIASAKRWGK
jgi:hypothetical protein